MTNKRLYSFKLFLNKKLIEKWYRYEIKLTNKERNKTPNILLKYLLSMINSVAFKVSICFEDEIERIN